MAGELLTGVVLRDPARVRLLAGMTLQLIADLTYSAGDDPNTYTVTWSSSKTATATVSNTGLVTAQSVASKDTATITATVSYGPEGSVVTFTDTIVITVEKGFIAPDRTKVLAAHTAGTLVLVDDLAALNKLVTGKPYIKSLMDAGSGLYIYCVRNGSDPLFFDYSMVVCKSDLIDASIPITFAAT